MARPLSAPRGTLPHPHPSPTPSPTPFFLIRSTPSNSRSLLLRLTWTHSPLGPTLSFAPSTSTAALLLHRRKGTHSVLFDNAGSPPPLVLFWDLTVAHYDLAASPKPLSKYYFVVVANVEVVLAVGDLATEFVKTKFKGQIPKARFLLLARKEHVAVFDLATMLTTRVRFAEGGPEHEVSIGCTTNSRGGEELWVSIDGKQAVQARRLWSNFRGNQTVFVDGTPVDVMWDLHSWWFQEPPRCKVLLLRARSALENGLRLEEEAAHRASPSS